MKQFLSKLTTLISITALLGFGIYIERVLSQYPILIPTTPLINSTNCSQTEEISYRSGKLASPDGNTSVYFNSIFRRLGSDEYSLRFGCARIFQTPSINLVIESAGQEKTIALDIDTKFPAFLDREITSHALVNLIPISFSPDGRFLAVDANYNFGAEEATSLLIIDLSTERLLKNHGDSDLYCRSSEEIPGQDVEGQTLIGFTSPTEFIVKCNQPYGCRVNLGMCNWSELVNLTNQTTQRISRDSVDAKRYGKVISPEEIKHQIVTYPRFFALPRKLASIFRNSSNCSQTEEIYYQSQKLASPDGNTSVYFNSIFRRLGRDEGCVRDFQTPSINLVIESAGQEKTIELDIELDMELTLHALVTLIPISFSPDGRFIAVAANYDFGQYHVTRLLIIDLSTERLVKNHGDSEFICRILEEMPGQDADYQTLISFTSPTEFIVYCEVYGCFSSSRMCEWSELVNLTNQTSQRISIDSVDAKMYGKVISPEEIKHQIVPRR